MLKMEMEMENGDDSEFIKKKKWTEAEKKILLRALKRYGSQNIESIKSELPNKSFFSIIHMIKKYQAIAELGKKEINSPLDIWLRSGIFEDEDSMIPETLLFIYLFENHPPVEETAGFDIKNVYKFIYEAASGMPMNTSLSHKTAFMFKDLILTADSEAWTKHESTITDYLIGKLCTVQSEKFYGKRKNK